MNPSSIKAGCRRRRRQCMVWTVFVWWAFLSTPAFAAAYADRLVWVFGWNLGKESDVPEITQMLETAARHGINGAMVSFGLDTLCKHGADYFRRLAAVQEVCERCRIELIPAVFSIGYGGGVLSHDRNLAEGLPVVDAPFRVQGEAAFFEPDAAVRLNNGGFEDFAGNAFKGFGFHDQPGEISFADTQIKRSGSASLRMENFTANPHGHGRVNQEVRLKPYRCYRASVWVKTEELKPADGLQLLALAGERNLAPRQFNLPATSDWRKLTMLFNSLNFDRVRLYAGVWGGKAGKFWLDDWTIEEVGPINVLRRPGTPVAVRSAEGETVYAEGSDYAPLRDPSFNPYRGDGEALALKLLPGTRMRNGERLRVSWYHALLIHDSQVTLCMGEPAVYEIMDHEMKLLAERLHPRRVMLNMDEVRLGGTCRACAGRNMGELLGECITKQVQIVRRHVPGAAVYVWSDMLDPNHNAHGNYYLVEGDFTGSWRHVPKDLIIGVWGGAPREKSLRFFADQGFATLVACYYDAADLQGTKNWLAIAKPLSNVRGFMYTPWTRKYTLLPAFGDLLAVE
jgi:hypothetical protein